METKGFFQFEIIISVLSNSFRFIRILCYVFTAIIKCLILSVRGPSKDGPRTERINDSFRIIKTHSGLLH